MLTITGDVCYRSKTLSLHSNYFRYGSLEGTSIVFLNETDKKSGPVTIKVADLIAFYNKVNRAVSNKIILDLQRNGCHLDKVSVAKIVYKDLWLYFPKDPVRVKRNIK